MRIISFCADGITDAAQKGFFDWVVEQDADIVCVQNLLAQEYDLYDSIYFPAGYNAYFYDAVEPNSNGVAIYCKKLPKAIMTGLGFTDFDMEGRYIQADYEHISVGCLLAPNGQIVGETPGRKKQFYEQYIAHLDKVSNKRREFIICGQWHIAHRPEDLQDPTGQLGKPGASPEEQQWMDHILTEMDYVDAFRMVNSDRDEFSYWPEGDREQNGRRTDYQIVTASLASSIEYGAFYKGKEFSSHAPLIMDYDIEL